MAARRLLLGCERHPIPRQGYDAARLLAVWRPIPPTPPPLGPPPNMSESSGTPGHVNGWLGVLYPRGSLSKDPSNSDRPDARRDALRATELKGPGAATLLVPPGKLARHRDRITLAANSSRPTGRRQRPAALSTRRAIIPNFRIFVISAQAKFACC
jgi:hypothetical protein